MHSRGIEPYEHDDQPTAKRRAAYAIAIGVGAGVSACLLAFALNSGFGVLLLAAAAALVTSVLAIWQLLESEDAYVDSLRRATITDALTQLLNRRGFQERLEIELARAQRDGAPMVLMIGDVDHFKQINDRLGHLGGDMALERVAGVISRNVRETDVTARVGGDEFAFILPRTSATQALFLADRIRTVLERSFAGTATSVTISLGAAEFPAHGRTSEELLDAADMALYEAKALGRNRVAVVGGLPEPWDADPAPA